LNEVENLYFRHARKPRLELPVESDSLDVDTQDAPGSTPHLSSDSQPTPDVLTADQRTDPSTADIQQTDTLEDVEEVTRATVFNASKFSSQDTTSSSKQSNQKSPYPPTPAVSPLQQNSLLHATTVASPSPASRRALVRPQISSLSLNNSSPSNSSSSLTYDSFWSSHSSSSLQYRNLLANSSSTTATQSQPHSPTPSTSTAPRTLMSPVTLAPSFQPQTQAPHSTMGAFNHSDLAFHNSTLPSYSIPTQTLTSITAQTAHYRR
jgi:hypothetical protein